MSAIKKEAETGSVRAEVKRTDIHNMMKIREKIRKESTANGINFIEDTIPITASVMEHLNIIDAPFARLEKPPDITALL